MRPFPGARHMTKMSPARAAKFAAGAERVRRRGLSDIAMLKRRKSRSHFQKALQSRLRSNNITKTGAKLRIRRRRDSKGRFA